MSSAPDMIVLGRIVGPYGLQGWVRLHPFGDDVAALGKMQQWMLGADPAGAEWMPHALRELRPHADGWIVLFAGIGDRNGAEAIDGLYVAAPRSELPKVADNEYYWADLVGLNVVNMQDEQLGKVVELLSCGAHEVLCVEEEVAGTSAGSAKRRLLPFVAQVVKNVDPANATIRVEWGSDW